MINGEIVTRVLGATDHDGVRIAARNKQNGAKVEMPWPAGLEGRAAHESIARRILNEGERLSWDRETDTTNVFLVFGS